MYAHYRPQRSWGKVIFSQACVILFTGGGGLPQCMLGYHPPDQPPRSCTHPLGAQTSPRSRHPGSIHPPGADTPPEQTPSSRHLPPEQTPPTSHPWEQNPPPRAEPPPPAQNMLGDTVNALAVRILLECNLVLCYVDEELRVWPQIPLQQYIYHLSCVVQERVVFHNDKEWH